MASTPSSDHESSVSEPSPAPASPPQSAGTDSPRSLAEWITFSVAALVLCAVIALVIVDWAVNQDRPPAFTVKIVDAVRVDDGRYYVPFSIQNTGGRIARTVQVTAELHLDGSDDETGEQQIDFLSGQEIKRGSFVFNHNPKDGEITLRVASYRLP